MGFKKITSKYPGTCTRCRQQISVGQEIMWARGERPFHATCSEAPAPEVPVVDYSAIPVVPTRQFSAGYMGLLEHRLDALHGAKKTHLATFRAESRAAWLAAGGCEECGGTGRVVTWDTMDGSGYTEYGRCPKMTAEHDCTKQGTDPEGVTQGIWRSREALPLDERHGVTLPAAFAERRDRLDALIARAQARLDSVRAAERPEKGKVVQVVKGRKVPRGTVGIVFWWGEYARRGFHGRVGRPQVRIGFCTINAETFFTVADNLEVVEVSEAARTAMTAQLAVAIPAARVQRALETMG